MSEATHTPGPWKVERRFSNECEIVPRITCQRDEDRGCGWIADMIGAPYLGHQSTLPNANLIAAAPDLKEVAEAYERWEADLILSHEAWNGGIAALPTLTQSLWDRFLEIQTMRNAALAKAKGGTP